MPSTYTSGLRLTNQANGENAATWGDIADANYEFIDDAITRVQTVNITGAASYTLTVGNGVDDEARSAILKITGTPASANSVIIPASEKIYGVHATHTSVSGGITVRTNTGTGVNFLSGQKGIVYCDGVSVYDLVDISTLDPSQNLADLTDVSAALVNLGLVGFVSVSAFDTNDFIVSGGLVQLNLSALFEMMWPVGSLYSNRTDGTNPGTLMGFGTWVSAGLGRVPVGVGTGVDANGVSVTFAAQTCGGEYRHTMTTAELVKHNHALFQFGGAQLGGGNTRVGTTCAGAIGELSDASKVVGSSSAFNIQQPWFSVYQWIRTV
jgi:hypothetical protein